MKERENSKSDVHTDWESASSWFSERQSDRINTSGGRYSEENRKKESAAATQKENRKRSEPLRKNMVAASASGQSGKRTNTSAANSKPRKNAAADIKSFSSYRAKKNNSGKSNDELRREHAEKTRKKRKQRILRSFFFTALIFVAAFIVASLTILFRIEEINIESDTAKYSEEEILEFSGIETGDNLWRTLTSDVYERLSYSLPYIGEVKIKRNIPSQITVIVREAIPEYALRNGKKYIIVDGHDKVLELKAAKPGGVPVIEGLDGSESEAGRTLKSSVPENYETAKEIIDRAKKNDIKISKVKVEDTNNISAVCDGKIRLDIGSASQLNEKLKMANEVVSKLKSEGSLAEGIINLKSATKAFYREGDIDKTEPVTEKKKEGEKSASAEGETVKSENKQSEPSFSENTTVSESTTKGNSDIPSPPSERPE